MRLLSKLFLFTVAFGVLCAAVASAASKNITVTLHNDNVQGLSCPFTEQFIGTIRGPAGTEITYRFERSNGYLATHSTTIPPGGSKQVSDSWTTSKSGSYWARLHVLTPQVAESEKASFSVHCPGGL